MGSEPDEAARVLTRLWQLIDAQDWDKITDLLDPAARIRYVHTGEVMDTVGYVQLNRNYPGRWQAVVQDLVSDGERAVSRTYVSDGDEGFWAASFATVRNGAITELTEVWADAGQEPPPTRDRAGAG